MITAAVNFVTSLIPESCAGCQKAVEESSKVSELHCHHKLCKFCLDPLTKINPVVECPQCKLFSAVIICPKPAGQQPEAKPTRKEYAEQAAVKAQAAAGKIGVKRRPKFTTQLTIQLRSLPVDHQHTNKPTTPEVRSAPIKKEEEKKEEEKKEEESKEDDWVKV